MPRTFLALLLALAPAVGVAQDDPEMTKVAHTYLDALSGKGDDAARDLIFGGASSDAKMFNLENWRIVSEDKPQTESGDLSDAIKMIADLDKAGRVALTKMLNLSGGMSDDVSTTEISKEDAARLLAPTRELNKRLLKAHPVLSHVARVGKDLYWHPKNPIRSVLAQTGKTGQYHLEFHYFHVETKEGPRQVPRVWPLRLLRLKTDKYDSGWKVLAASDWSID